MKVAISGASGLVGQALASSLAQDGIDVLRLVRGKPALAGEASWNPAEGLLNPDLLEGCEAVVNLAGESVAGGTWSAQRKRRIIESRIQSTRTLCAAMARMKKSPEVMVSASAIGHYGNRGDVWVDESSALGQGFLAGVCRDWEAEAQEVQKIGVRVVRLRIGLVLSLQGGALSTMLPPFKLGLGGALGDGQQYMSWITLHDLVRAIRFCISRKDIQGPVNAVAPSPVTNMEFTKTLGKALHRPTFLSPPAFVLRTLLGQMAEEMFLTSIRVRPAVLAGAGFDYSDEKLEPALRRILGKEE